MTEEQAAKEGPFTLKQRLEERMTEQA